MNPSFTFRWTGIPLAILVLLQSLFATPVYALSGGPTQPEFGQPQTVGADDMVDVFSGNFQYSIPLFEIGGYPITLSYASDHGMEQEASWVGAGWTLNPGVISRQVRGLPDDFRGEGIVHRQNMKDNVTLGVSPGADVELFGRFGLSTALNFTHNNYTGFDFSRDFSPQVNLMKLLSPSTSNANSTGEDLSSSTGGGDQGSGNSNGDSPATPVSPPAAKPNNFGRQLQQIASLNNFSASFNSRSGLQHAAWSASAGGQWRFLKGGASLYQGGITYTPTADLPRKTLSLTYTMKVGFKVGLPDATSAVLRAFYANQSLASRHVERSAFGYLYLEGAAQNAGALMDYNVEQGGIINQDASRLPIPFGTPDIYAVTGPGVGGQIEISRTDAPIFRPAETTSRDVTTGLGGEVSLGNIVHAGANIRASKVTSRKGSWPAEQTEFTYTGGAQGGITSSSYMRFIGDQSVQTSREWYQNIGGSEPVVPQIQRNELKLELRGLEEYESETGPSSSILSNSLRSGRRDRSPGATVVNYLTAGEAHHGALDRKIEQFYQLDATAGNFKSFGSTTVERVRGHGRQPHHVSEISVLNPSGQRYVYGLPVYNHVKKEITFNAASLLNGPGAPGPQGSEQYGVVNYGSANNPLVSVNNSSGNDHYFDEVVTPAYPVAHLLTGVLSPDYLDRTGDGLTLDDLGNYVKIGYAPLRSNAAPRTVTSLGYRTPLGAYTAVLNEGNLADDQDDKASYSYGSKEVYYVHHMDSKTHRAVFLTSERTDALPMDEHGHIQEDGPVMRRLDSIKIFTLAELETRGAAAQPIKTVHFTYAEDAASQISGDLPNARLVSSEYPLTGGEQQRRHGKLTLRAVSFTYAGNQRGRDNPYTFTYKVGSTDDGNKVLYQPFMSDRWGTQRPASSNVDLAPLRYPYTLQDEEIADDYSSLGNLTQIGLPSGGSIEVEYEADDYAYVQNYRAARMFSLAGFSENAPNENVPVIPNEDLYTANFGLGKPHLYTYVRIGTRGDGQDLELLLPQDRRRRYLEGVDQLYFSSRLRLLDGAGTYERVTGYATFDDDYLALAEGEAGQQYLVLKLRALDVRNRETGRRNAIHPISYSGLEKLRTQLPRLLNSSRSEDLTPIGLAALLKEFGSIYQQYFKSRLSLPRANAQRFDADASYVRLTEPNYRKFGGGSRVRTVTLYDNWLTPQLAAESGETVWRDASLSYRKVYDYTTVDAVTKDTISSGVAANEPLNGKEEMLMVNLGKEGHPRFLAPDRTYYLEGPAGLSLFPGPSVGYGKVSMRMELDTVRFQQSRPGRTVHKFFTARDFPVRVRQTPIKRKRVYPLPVTAPFVSLFTERLGLTQGFTIEVNNMHGKLKEVREEGASGQLISSTEYRYRTGEDGGGAHLDNEVDVIETSADSQGRTRLTKRKNYLGLHTSVWMEQSFDETETVGGGMDLNTEVSVIPFLPPIPVGFPFPWPNANHGISSLQTAAITKFINRMGILEEVTVTNNGSSLTTKNYEFDALTGAVVLSGTQNEYGGEVYQHTSPAYWMDSQRGMGPAYADTGKKFANVTVSDEGILAGTGTNNDNLRVPFPGDEYVLVEDMTSASPVVRRLSAVPDSTAMKLINPSGAPISTTPGDDGNLLILTRSGRRNLLTPPSAQVTALTKPDAGFYYTQSETTAQGILSSSAMVYSDDWGNLCTPVGPPIDPCDTCSTCSLCPGCDSWPTPNCDECDNLEECDDCIEDSWFEQPIVAPEPRRVDGQLKVATAIDYNSPGMLDQIRRDCDACLELYRAFANAGLFPAPERYTDCLNSDPQIGGYDQTRDDGPYTLTTEGRLAIENCDYLSTDAEFLEVFDASLVPLSFIEGTIPGNCKRPGRNNTFLQSLPANTNIVSDNTILSSGNLTTTTGQDGQNLCFPWHKDSGINPYIDGRRGNWRVKATYTLRQRERTYAAAVAHEGAPPTNDNDYTQPLLFEDGVLESYQPFWYSTDDDISVMDYYIETNEVVRYDEHGHELETQDALNIPSGAQYGFLQNLPLAVAQNARHLDIGFDGFEDYTYDRSGTEETFWQRHFGLLGRSISETDTSRLTQEHSHTGNYAYQTRSTPLRQTFPVLVCDSVEVYCPSDEGCSSCVNGFTPRADSTRYLFSAWVASDQSLAFGMPPREAGGQNGLPYLRVSTDAGGSTVETARIDKPTVVEGWQQIQMVFTVPPGAKEITLMASPPQDATQDYFFDDIRVQPYESEMTSYVYDYRTLRLMAQLDDRGYAVLYEYDDEGMLIRQKRETERGIMTITEQHTNLAPTDPSRRP
jgi:hypothetical protein